jgi:hypothetical protein
VAGLEPAARIYEPIEDKDSMASGSAAAMDRRPIMIV